MQKKLTLLLTILTTTLFSQNTYTLTAPDTVLYGQRYNCFISFDSIKYRNCDIEVLFLNTKVPSVSKYMFELELFPVFQINDYELKIKISNCKEMTDLVIKKRYYRSQKIDPSIKTTTSAKYQSELLNTGKQTFKSKNYTNFEDYLLSTLKTNKFSSRDVITFTYDIFQNNSLKFIVVTGGKLSNEDNAILKNAVESCKYWILENAKQNSYRVIMQIDFSKLD